jgi:hypothetical protein
MRTFGKPVGFWVSVAGEDDWPQCCQDNEYDQSRLKIGHLVTLDPDSQVLRIDSSEGLLAFHGTYGVETDFERRNRDVFQQDSWPIDWYEVAQDYDGIIIAPYQWGSRLQVDFYYNWECASGCIWTTDAIASVEIVSSSTKEKECQSQP